MGSKYKIDGINYEIGESNASVLRIGFHYSGSLTIPETVSYKGKTYHVTKIGFRAFKGCTGLTSVTIPNSVTEIGSSAFDGCSERG